MRLLFTTDTLASGGKERQIVELAKGLSRDTDTEVHIAVLSGKIQYPEVHSLPVTVHLLERSCRKDPSILLRLDRLCRDARIELIHSWDTMSALYALPVAKIRGIPFVNGIIRSAPPAIRFGSKLWLRSGLTLPFSDLVVANSRAGLRAFGLENGKSVCIHNGFDFSRIATDRDPAAVRAELRIPPGQVVGMVGALSARKDYQTFLAAARLLLDEGREETFCIVGDGPLRDRLEQAAAASGRRDRIIFTGRRTDVESVIGAFDVAVLATDARIHGEGIPNAVMEYMAMGKPVVATEAGGTTEILRDGETGFLVPNRDAAALADRIGRLLDDPDEAKRMGAAGRNVLFREFSLDRMTREYRAAYESLRASSARRRDTGRRVAATGIHALTGGNTAMRKRTVIMVGPARTTRGGMASVIDTYFESPLPRQENLLYLPTNEGRGPLGKGVALACALREFGRLVRSVESPIVHIHGASRRSFYRKSLFIRAARRAGVPVIFHLHGAEFLDFYYRESGKRTRAFIAKTLGQCDHVIGLSEHWRRELAAIIGREHGISALFNPVSIPDIPEEGALRIDGRRIDGDDRTHVISMGVIGERKGAFLILKAAERILARRRDVRFTLCGNGAVDRAARIVREKGLGDSVSLPGWITDKDTYLRSADIFTLPSYNEGLPVALLEAMAYGLPVITTPVGGIPEVIRDGENGFLIPPGDDHALEDRIIRLLESPELRRAMGSAARETVERQFSRERIIEGLRGIYDTVESERLLPRES